MGSLYFFGLTTAVVAASPSSIDHARRIPSAYHGTSSGLPLLEAKRAVLREVNAGAGARELTLEEFAGFFKSLTYPERDGFELVLASGFDVEARDGQGNTLLHRLILARRHYSFVQIALQYGADAGAMNAAGKRAGELLPPVDHPQFTKTLQLLDAKAGLEHITAIRQEMRHIASGRFWNRLLADVSRAVPRPDLPRVSAENQAELVLGDHALLVTHASYSFLGAERIRDPLNRLIEASKSKGYPVYYLMEDTEMPDQSDRWWIPDDLSSSGNLISSAGEHRAGLAFGNVTLAGGWLGACLSNTMGNLARQIGKLPDKKLRIRLPIASIFSGSGVSLLDQYEFEFWHDPVLLARRVLEASAIALSFPKLRVEVLADGKSLGVQQGPEKPEQFLELDLITSESPVPEL